MTTIRRRRDMPEGVALFLAKTTGTIPTVAIPEKKTPPKPKDKRKNFQWCFGGMAGHISAGGGTSREYNAVHGKNKENDAKHEYRGSATALFHHIVHVSCVSAGGYLNPIANYTHFVRDICS